MAAPISPKHPIFLIANMIRAPNKWLKTEKLAFQIARVVQNS